MSKTLKRKKISSLRRMGRLSRSAKLPLKGAIPDIKKNKKREPARDALERLITQQRAVILRAAKSDILKALRIYVVTHTSVGISETIGFFRIKGREKFIRITRRGEAAFELETYLPISFPKGLLLTSIGAGARTLGYRFKPDAGPARYKAFESFSEAVARSSYFKKVEGAGEIVLVHTRHSRYSGLLLRLKIPKNKVDRALGGPPARHSELKILESCVARCSAPFG